MSAPLGRLANALADRYTIERELGHGGMATVYLAHDIKHDRKVAIKVLKPELAATLGGERFLREIGMMGNLRHPHILPLFDSGMVEGQWSTADRIEPSTIDHRPSTVLYYVMPYIQGETLEDRLAREGQLPIDEAVRLATEVAEALGYAHAQGVVHRDVKPANILLEQGHAVLADFGIARAVGSSGGERLTASGLSIGTPHYMSPEQSFAEDEVDGRSDLYSLGCVLYEMLGGETPYTGPNPQIIIAKRMAEPVPHVSTIRETVSPALDTIVTSLMSKSPVDRPQTAEQLIDALRTGSAPAPVNRPRQVPRWPWIAAAVLVVLGLGWWWQGRAAMPDATFSRDRLAVVPFTVQATPDLAYLGEGVVDLMSAKLDGVGALQVVNPRAVIGMVHRDGIALGDARLGPSVAAAFGAGRYVTGHVLGAGSRLSLSATLHDARSGADTGIVIATATVEGTLDGLFVMIDSLAFKLLAGTLDDSTFGRLDKLATSTTSSLPALKAFLEGERLVRSGDYINAADAYERAIAMDSVFALAWYRKSSLGEWIDAYDARSSADMAMAYADRLSPRDQDLVHALQLRRHGRSTESERAYRAHLLNWPDDVEAMVQLGEILFHDGPRRGQSMMQAIPIYERAIRHEPRNVDARVHLSRLYALNGDLDTLTAFVSDFERLVASSATDSTMPAGGERLFEVQAVGAYATHDTAAIADITAQIADKPWNYWMLAAHGVSRFARDPAGAQTLLSGYTGDAPLVGLIQTDLALVLGQTDAFWRSLDRIPGGRTIQSDMLESFVLTSGAVPKDSARMIRNLERVRRADPAAMRMSNWVPAYEDLTDQFHRFERDYHEALLLIQLGRTSEATPIIASLRTRTGLDNLGDIQTDAVKSLEAEARLAAGDGRGALEILRTITYEAPHSATYHAVADGSRSRYLRAELELMEGGDTTRAIGFLRGFDESWSPWDMFHRPIVYQRLAEVAEAQGRNDDALRYYNWLLAMWRDADPSHASRIAMITERRNSLSEEAR